MEERSLRTKFVTAYDMHRVAEVPIAVPVRLGRRGLSDVINHLLGRKVKPEGEGGSEEEDDEEDDDESQRAVKFEFLVDGRLLRGSLAKLLLERGASSEGTLTLEYFPAVPAPAAEGPPDQPLPDWVGALASAGVAGILVGAYDGGLRLVRPSEACKLVGAQSGHVGAIKALAAAPAADAGGGASAGAWCVSGSQDHTVRTWRLAGAGAGANTGAELVPVGVGRAHGNSVECVAVAGNRFASGDWEGIVCLWDGPKGKGEEVGAAGGAGKRRRGSEGDAVAALVELAPASTLRAHAQCVSGLAFGVRGAAAVDEGGGGIGKETTLYTCGGDHAIKTWDLETLDPVTTINAGHAPTCLAWSSTHGLAATGHADGVSRLWDPRVAAAATAVAAQLGSERSGAGWISGVAWSPEGERPYMLTTAAHDGRLRVWDVRGKALPLHTIRAHRPPPAGEAATSKGGGGSGKALALAWQSAESGGHLVSGGDDSRVAAFSWPTLAVAA